MVEPDPPFPDRRTRRKLGRKSRVRRFEPARAASTRARPCREISTVTEAPMFHRGDSVKHRGGGVPIRAICWANRTSQMAKHTAA